MRYYEIITEDIDQKVSDLKPNIAYIDKSLQFYIDNYINYIRTIDKTQDCIVNYLHNIQLGILPTLISDAMIFDIENIIPDWFTPSSYVYGNDMIHKLGAHNIVNDNYHMIKNKEVLDNKLLLYPKTKNYAYNAYKWVINGKNQGIGIMYKSNGSSCLLSNNLHFIHQPHIYYNTTFTQIDKLQVYNDDFIIWKIS